ncbi:hypothetical protein U1872_07945 [Sphingomonas sp. RB3P16]|uniref:hypothetical protein n=1 Tax=Parasphingomonas frigoris TaxID=3096163 RepID=UPI002FC5D18F
MANDGDNCSICRRLFEQNDLTFGGATNTGAPALVGECCLKRLKIGIIKGVFLTPDFPFPLNSRKSDPNEVRSPEEVNEAINAFRSVGKMREGERRKIAARAGIDPKSAIMNTSTTEWKTDDANWFAANPSRTHRLRPMIGGEKESFGAVGNQQVPLFHQLQVLVRQVEPGARVRLPFGRDLRTQIPDDDNILYAMFDAFSQGQGGTFVSTADVLSSAIEMGPKGRA